MKINDIEQKARIALEKCFKDIPFVDLDLESYQFAERDYFYDFKFNLEINNNPRSVIVEIKNNGEPRYARQAVNQLVRFLKDKQDTYGVFIAPYISPQSAEICSEANIGHIDFAGNCHLSFEQIYIHKEGNPNPFSNKRTLRSLYSPKAERILRVLLANGPKEWKVEQLANEAEVSFGQIAKVKKLLMDREWLVSQTVGFSLSEPFSLLEEWASNYKFNRNEIFEFYTMHPVSDFEYQLRDASQELGIKYGLTGFSGAAWFAPTVRYQRSMAYVQGELDPLSDLLEIKPVSSGSNVTLLKPYDEGVFYRSEERSGVSIISPIQIYLDLLKIHGRGEQAADAILDKVIREIW